MKLKNCRKMTVGLEQRVADDEGCRRRAERDADRHREQQQREQDDADDRHQCVPSIFSRWLLEHRAPAQRLHRAVDLEQPW